MVIWWEQNLTQNYVETSPFMSFANILLNWGGVHYMTPGISFFFWHLLSTLKF